MINFFLMIHIFCLIRMMLVFRCYIEFLEYAWEQKHHTNQCGSKANPAEKEKKSIFPHKSLNVFFGFVVPVSSPEKERSVLVLLKSSINNYKVSYSRVYFSNHIDKKWQTIALYKTRQELFILYQLRSLALWYDP